MTRAGRMVVRPALRASPLTTARISRSLSGSVTVAVTIMAKLVTPAPAASSRAVLTALL